MTNRRPRPEKPRLEVQGLDLPHDRPIPNLERNAIVRALRHPAFVAADEANGGRDASDR